VSNGNAKTATTGARPGHGEDADDRSGLLELALISLAAGAVTGLAGAVFRLCLDRADWYREALVAWAHHWGSAGLVLITPACAIATAVAVWMVRRLSPYATGPAGRARVR
jgi:CIC family chloride channel protein